jgi:uncharacterized protein YlzI (FlbEa/FlbD family)
MQHHLEDLQEGPKAVADLVVGRPLKVQDDLQELVDPGGRQESQVVL